MDNCSLSPKETIKSGAGTQSRTINPNRTGTIGTDIQGHTIMASQSRPADDTSTNIASPNAGFFNAAQNLAITGGQFLEVHGNYVSVSSTSVNLTDALTPLPPQRHSSTMFTGRGPYLERLKHYFSSSDREERKSFLLYGMGGIGKTQICFKFIEKCRKLFSDIFWIDASSESSIDLRLRQIAQSSNAPPGAVTSAASALDWISGKEDWLMIYDNADEGYRVVEKFLPPGDGGNILITSRNKDLMRITSKESSMEVLEMGEEEALSLLAKSAMLDYTSEGVKDQAQELVSKLGGVPLAIDQAGAYMVSCNCSLDDYLGLFVKNQDQLLSEPSFKGASDYGASTYGTWEISMKEIEARASNRTDPRAVAADSAIALYNIFALLHHENIPAEELFEKAAENYKKRNINEEKELGLPLLLTVLNTKVLLLNERGEWDKIQFYAGIQVLLSFSFIRGSGKLYSIHSLVHSWSRNRIPRTEFGRQHLITRALISCSVNLDDYDNHKFCGLLVPHIRASNGHAAEFQLKHSYYDDECDRFSQVFFCTGSWNEAENLQMSVMKARKAKLGLDHRQTLISMSNLAYIYEDQGRWDEVEKIHMQVMETSREKLGDEDQFTLGSMIDLANAYRELEKTGEAERLEAKVMEIRTAKLGPDHPSTLRSMENLAVTYMRQDKHIEAEQLLLHVVEVKNNILGSSHYDTLFARSNLAAACYNLGKWDEAVKLYFDVFEVRKVKFGPNHPETLESMGLLGNAYIQQGRTNEGQFLLSQAVRLMEETIGPQHPTTLWHRKQLHNSQANEVSA